jgi:hypothetical protein
MAVKRVSETSRQGWKEFVTEVTVISRPRHPVADPECMPGVNTKIW